MRACLGGDRLSLPLLRRNDFSALSRSAGRASTQRHLTRDEQSRSTERE